DLLSEDDPLLTWGTGELDRHRIQLQQGTTKVVGVEQFEGRTAVKVDLEAIYDRPVFVYLDPETLFPLGYLELGQQWRVISYETIETTTLSDMPVELFKTNTTEMDYWHYHGQLSPETAAGFVRYPV